MNFLRSVEMFLRVADRGSFSKAALALNKTQPAVSRQIALLEQELGIQLFRRTTRSLILTEQGARFYLKAQDIVQSVAEAKNVVLDDQQALSGQLKIAAPVAYGGREVIPKLWGFRQQYPQLKLDVMLSDTYVDLIEEGVDVSIRLGNLDDSTLKARRLHSYQRFLVASPHYLQTYGEPQNLDALQQHHLIQFSLLRVPNRWQFKRNGKTHELTVSGELRINNADGILQAALAHQGIALMPDWLASQAIASGELVPILTDYQAQALDLHLLFPPGRFVTRAVKAFADYFAETVKSAS